MVTVPAPAEVLGQTAALALVLALLENDHHRRTHPAERGVAMASAREAASPQPSRRCIDCLLPHQVIGYAPVV